MVRTPVVWCRGSMRLGAREGCELAQQLEGSSIVVNSSEYLAVYSVGPLSPPAKREPIYTGQHVREMS